ncbi:MAG: pyruvate kinase [Planctomycetota bacterium]|jgi:pyruvate kinase|nr:pyruvate kinase [Planctomycetota bacterium]
MSGVEETGMRYTKIVATIGPASNSPEMLSLLLQAGVNVFRLNFSHGSHESHRNTVERIRQAAKGLERNVAILQDLCGPKVRVGRMRNGGVELEQGGETLIVTDEVEGTAESFQTQYEFLPRDVRPGDRILLDDGKIELEALESDGERKIRAKVTRGGVLKDHKGMNLPGVAVSAPSVTSKDMDDLRLGISLGVDFVALSFIRAPEDLRPVRQTLSYAGSPARVIAKIEKPEAIDRIEEIVRSSDGIMVARGDLGIEMPIQRVPVLQKYLIRLANSHDRYVITATQMLESMTFNAIPTRAEVSDVANAIVDGSDAVMLSGETAAGCDPVGTVRMMSSIAEETEQYLRKHPANWNWVSDISTENPMQDALGRAALRLSRDLSIKAIGVSTRTGGTALFLSKARPFAPIVAFTPDADSARRLHLYWGVIPVHAPEIRNRDQFRIAACREFLRLGLAKSGDKAILVTGSSFGEVGSADDLMIATVNRD